MSPSPALTAGSLNPRWPRPRAEPLFGESLATAIALLLPFSRLVTFEFVGVVFLFDILSPLLLFALLIKPIPRQVWAPITPVLIAFAIWLFGQVITDFVRSTPTADMARGLSKILLLMSNIAAIWLLAFGRGKVLASFAVGLGLTLGLVPFVAPVSDLAMYEPWKFGMGYGLAMAGCGLALWLRTRSGVFGYVPAAYLAILAGISLFLNSRSLFAICLLAAAYVALANWTASKRYLVRRIKPWVFVILILTGLGAGQGVMTTYSAAAEQGLLGAEARAKYMQQAASGDSLISVGRVEVFVAIEAIKDSPIIGHGSYARDPLYIRLLFNRYQELRLPYVSDYFTLGIYNDFVIPSHSHFFGSWVEAGITGAIAWAFVLYLVLAALYYALKAPGTASAIAVLAAFSLSWDVIFSPFAADGRVIKAFEICLLLYLLQVTRERLRNAANTSKQVRFWDSASSSPDQTDSTRTNS